MLLAVVIAKSLIELSLMFIVGRKISPRLILDQHIPLATSSWLIIAWVLVVQMKIEMCLEMGIATCQ